MSQKDLDAIRHTLAHLLAASVRELYPDAKNAIGPAIENGFYQDFDMGKHKLSDEDLPKIEEKMKEKLASWDTFDRKEVTAEEAKKEFDWNEYKRELIEEFSVENQTITFYTIGGFVDLCRGGHTDNPSKDIHPDAFALTNVAGAYWRGDEKNKMLTRIYGVAFESKKQLDEYHTLLEEAQKRDHRKLGKELDLFTFSDLVGSGLPMFTPKGTLLRNLIVERIYDIQRKHGFTPVWIPHIAKDDLYKTSGHWDKFGDELFKVKGQTKTEFVMKPMNCPHHTQIYASQPRSYRDLPIRYAEATTNYRDEQPGELLGLSRVRSLTQDDGHVFCTLNQAKEEARNIVDVVRTFYTQLNMFSEDTYWVSLSVRDPNTPEKYLGDGDIWDTSEKILEEVANEEKLNFKRIEGEAAFYGPKLDFMFRDALGREWQLATVQLDLNMPERFGLEYTAQDGTKKTPVMIHRAIAGSLERFLSVMIEHFAGAFPLWLAPVQVKVLPIGEGHHGFAREVFEALNEKSIRVEVDESGETLGKKIHNAKSQKVPYMLVIGDNEVKDKEVTVESRDEGKIGSMNIEALLERFTKEVQDRS